MTDKINAINQLRPKIISQGIVDHQTMAKRMSKNTTYNEHEVYSILRLYADDINAALQAGETVKVDGVCTLTPNMKVGGEVNVSIRHHRGALAALQNPRLWTANKVANHRNMSKTTGQLIKDWNAAHPDDPVVE